MNPVSQDMKDTLVDAGVGTFAATSGWAIYISREPSSPDEVVTLYDSGGPEPDYLMDGTDIGRPNMQARIRGAPGGYLDAWAKAKEVVDALSRLSPQTINGTWYAGVWQQTAITALQYDDSNRPILTVNFRIRRY